MSNEKNSNSSNVKDDVSSPSSEQQPIQQSQVAAAAPEDAAVAAITEPEEKSQLKKASSMITPSGVASNSSNSNNSSSSTVKGITLSARAMAAGGKRKQQSGDVGAFGGVGGALAKFQPGVHAVGLDHAKWLVVGDGVAAPFMALALRVHGIQCDLAHHPSTQDIDRGTIVLTPSVTQILGDVIQCGVPTGSVIGRVLTFDHVGNDMCDIDLNEFREKGDAPTFFACDRTKIESSLLSLCRTGTYSCNVIPRPTIDKGCIQALDPTGVRVTFSNGVAHDYQGIICTARNQSIVPELTLTNEELQHKEENTQRYRQECAAAHRWLEVCVPPLPELGKNEKRFTPGSQEVVEIITPRATKMIVRPTMLATKLFYNVTISIPDQAQDPRLKTTSMKQFWDDVIDHWTGGIPGYVTHTLFRPMFTHLQQHFQKSSALVHKTPTFVLPHWTEGEGRIVKIGHAVHQSNFDAIDLSDAQTFSDCFNLARALSAGEKVDSFVDTRRLSVLEEHDFHNIVTNYALKERGQMKYAASRFTMKLLRRYKRAWRHILNNHITLIAKAPK